MDVNNRNTGLWTVGGAVLGAGAGVGASAAIKPYLKNGEPSAKLAEKISMDVFMTQEKTKEIIQLGEDIKKLDNKDEIIKLVTTDEKYKFLSEDFVTKIKNAKDIKEIEKVFENIVDDAIDTKILTAPDGKELYKNFKENKDSLSKEAQEAIEKALKTTKRNSMLLFGGIGAAVLGITAFLLSRNKKD